MKWKLYIFPLPALMALALVVPRQALQANAGPVSEEIKVGAEVRGKIKAVRVREGDPVRQGQIIAILENDDLLAECASAEVQLKEKQTELRRLMNEAPSQGEGEPPAAMMESEAAFENARAEVALARARIARARLSWEKTFIRAPISGAVLRRQRNPGETVSEQGPPILTLLPAR